MCEVINFYASKIESWVRNRISYALKFSYFSFKYKNKINIKEEFKTIDWNQHKIVICYSSHIMSDPISGGLTQVFQIEYKWIQTEYSISIEGHY
jgi:hypothetical protein